MGFNKYNEVNEDKIRPLLPKKSINVLKKWLYDHRYKPYPTDSEKNTLIKEANLTDRQVFFTQIFILLVFSLI